SSSSPAPYFSTCIFFFSGSRAHRDLHSFPTRRSSDLGIPRFRNFWAAALRCHCGHGGRFHLHGAAQSLPGHPSGKEAPRQRHPRSEEHTSELQSQSNLVCRLLLEKKKKNTIHNKLCAT